jgi:hypothetical protein
MANSPLVAVFAKATSVPKLASRTSVYHVLMPIPKNRKKDSGGRLLREECHVSKAVQNENISSSFVIPFSRRCHLRRPHQGLLCHLRFLLRQWMVLDNLPPLRPSIFQSASTVSRWDGTSATLPLAPPTPAAPDPPMAYEEPVAFTLSAGGSRSSPFIMKPSHGQHKHTYEMFQSPFNEPSSRYEQTTSSVASSSMPPIILPPPRPFASSFLVAAAAAAHIYEPYSEVD